MRLDKFLKVSRLIKRRTVANDVSDLGASLVIAALPTFLVFALCQNIIIRGIVVPTEK